MISPSGSRRLVYNTWGIGSNTTGNMGALIVVAKEDRKMWIEVGKGVAGSPKIDIGRQIGTDTIAPNFKADDYAGGIREAAIAIRDRIFQPSTTEDLSNIPVDAPGPDRPTPTPDAPGDIGLPGPEGPSGGSGSGSGSAPPSFPPPSHDPGPQSPPNQGRSGADLHFDCGKWFCFAIGILILISMFRRKRQYGYGYGPTYGPAPMGSPPPYGPRGYGYRPSGGGLGGMLGGVLTGMLLGRMGRRGGGGGSRGGPAAAAASSAAGAAAAVSGAVERRRLRRRRRRWRGRRWLRRRFERRRRRGELVSHGPRRSPSAL